MNLARKKRFSPWTLHRLEAYVTLTFLECGAMSENTRRKFHEHKATTRRANDRANVA